MLQALYLFTASDIAPTIVPNVSFGILGALSGPLLTTNDEPTALHVFMRTVPVTLFIWGNVLIFTISNQCSPKSVVEDQINKPWRPVPSGLVTATSGRNALWTFASLMLIFSWILGVHWETGLCCFLTWIYNDRSGGDKSPILRNLLLQLFLLLHS
jgi:hypothetical protein